MPSSDLLSSRQFITHLLNSLRGFPHASADTTSATASNTLINASEPVKRQLLALHVFFPNELLPALDLLDRRLVTRFWIRRTDFAKDVTLPTTNVATLTSAALHGNGVHENEGTARLSQVLPPRADETSAPCPALTGGIGQTDPSDAEMTDAPQTNLSAERTVQRSSGTAAQQASVTNMDTIFYVRSAQQRSSRYSTSHDSTTSYEVRLKAWSCSCPAFAFSAFPSVHPEPDVPMYDAAEVLKTQRAVELENAEQDDGWTFGGMSLGEATPPVCKHLLACVLAERCIGLFGGFVEEREVGVEEAAAWAAGWGD